MELFQHLLGRARSVQPGGPRVHARHGRSAGAAPGWPSSPRIEDLRQQWLDAPDIDAQKALAKDLQQQALIDVPYVPLGQVLGATAYRNNLTGVLNGFVLFWNVRKT